MGQISTDKFFRAYLLLVCDLQCMFLGVVMGKDLAQVYRNYYH